MRSTRKHRTAAATRAPVAGIASEGNVIEVPLDEWKKTIETDLSGVFHGCRAALPELLKTKGCIVNTASVSGLAAD